MTGVLPEGRQRPTLSSAATQRLGDFLRLPRRAQHRRGLAMILATPCEIRSISFNIAAIHSFRPGSDVRGHWKARATSSRTQLWHINRRTWIAQIERCSRVSTGKRKNPPIISFDPRPAHRGRSNSSVGSHAHQPCRSWRDCSGCSRPRSLRSVLERHCNR